MKTAEVSLEEIFPITSGIIGIGWHQIDQKQKDELIEAIKEHAKQVAQKALEDASERVKYNVSDFYCDCGQSHAHWTVDKQSILSTPLIIE